MKLFDKFRVKIKCFMKNHMLMNQFCKKCGKSEQFDFQVSDKDWEKIPVKYQNKVLCLKCFIDVFPESEVEVMLYM